VPKVSVIIPSYNHAPYLRQRVESVLNQTFQDFEVLILDDASKDKSVKILRRYTEFPQVSLHVNPTNSGSVFRQWEKGVKLARGEYVWIAESDDWAAPTFLSRLVLLLDQNPDVGVAYAQSYIADADSKIKSTAYNWTEDLHPTRWKTDFVSSGRDEVSSYLVRKNTIPNASAVLMRASVLASVSAPDPSFRLCGDWLHWIRMLMRSNVGFVAEPLNYWRLNTSNARSSAPGTLEWIEGERVLSEAVALLNLGEAEKNAIVLEFLKRCWGWQKDFIESRLQPSRRLFRL